MMETMLPMPFVVGAPRSGTTLLRMMLDSHPEMAIPPETGFISEVIDQFRGAEGSLELLLNIITGYETWVDFHLSTEELAGELERLPRFCAAEGIRSFYRLYAKRFAKSRWGDKTPNYGLQLEAIAGLLPEAHFIHIIRDGRDVAASIRDLWFSPSRNFAELGSYWNRRVRAIREQGARYPFYYEIRFEDLINNTEQTLRDICLFIEMDFHSRMMDYYLFSQSRLQEHEARFRPDGTLVIGKEARLEMQRLTTHPPDRSRIGSWKTVMNKEEHENFLRSAGPLLHEMRYI
jgi:hypothetical protein